MNSLAIAALTLAACPAWLMLPVVASAQGDYTQIASLRYSSVTGTIWSHTVPAAQGANVAKLQSYLRDGIDGEPLSPQYVLIVADESDDYPLWFGPISRFHGISSPRLIWQVMHDRGAPPQSLCTSTALYTTLITGVTPAMDAAAAPYKVGGLVGYETLPTYQAAFSYVATHPGAALLLSTDGFDSRLVIGVKDGKSIWLEYPEPGPPNVVLRDDPEGAAVWESQLFGQSYGPENYMLVIE